MVLKKLLYIVHFLSQNGPKFGIRVIYGRINVWLNQFVNLGKSAKCIKKQKIEKIEFLRLKLSIFSEKSDEK
jgi:hypothetical protein